MKHRHTAYYLSAALLLLLLSIPLASAHGRSSSRDIPPALPQHRWDKLTPLNYTELHAEFSEVLSCLSMPVGVLGSCWRYVMMVLNAIDIGKFMFYLERDRRNSLGFFGGCFTVGWSIFTVLASFKSQRECAEELNYLVFRSAINMDIGSTICSAVSGAIMAISSCTPPRYKKAREKFLATGVVFSFLAFIILAIQALIVLFRVTEAAGVTKRYFLQPDRVYIGEAALAYLVEALASFFFILVYLKELPETKMIVGSFMFVTVILGFVTGGMGTLLLGKIMGDPWGEYLVGTAWGKGFVALTSLGLFVGFHCLCLEQEMEKIDHHDEGSEYMIETGSQLIVWSGVEEEAM